MAVYKNSLVHLDLKGSPLKVDYLAKLFPAVREWGATGLLLEWEDTFPYVDRLAGIGSSSLPADTWAYSEAEVRQIHSLAAENNLSVIPLVQTFGHLEFVLKQPEWRELREVPQYPSSLCPSHPLALPLVTEMLDQVIRLSPASRHIHIGADEVWHLGLCSQCSERPKSRVFLSHVLAVLKHLSEKHPHVQPIMWDDMLRNVDQTTLEEFKLGQLVEPMVWHYQSGSSFSLPQDMWNKYSQLFPRVWVASAFKGATGSCQLLPTVSHHVSNHQQWLSVLTSVQDKFQLICGLVLTGWSRYDHYATLCELLPPALPSLALCLRVWASQSFSDLMLNNVSKQLGYTEFPLNLCPHPRPQAVAQNLNFPGWKLAVGVQWLANLRAKHTAILNSDEVNTWLNPWQIENNFTNPMQIEHLHNSFKELQREWDHVERYLLEHLGEVYHERTIAEWIGTLVTPCRQALDKQIENVTKQLEPS